MKYFTRKMLLISVLISAIALTGCGDAGSSQEDEKGQFLVVFQNYDDSILQSTMYDEGAMPVYTGITPVREADIQYAYYTFTGWTPEIKEVTAAAFYRATYTEGDLQEYTITFANYDGTPLQSTKWKYGEMPVYSSEAPTKPNTEFLNFTFDGWTSEIQTVECEATYTAHYAISVSSFGKYPQTVVEDVALISALSTASDSDLDGLIEFDSNSDGVDEEYFHLVSASPYESFYSSHKITSNSGNIEFKEGFSYYFKVEPITWTMLDEATGFITTDRILFGTEYYPNEYNHGDATRTIGGKTVYCNNYEYSTLRAVLNGLDFSSYSATDGTNAGNFSGNAVGIFSKNGGFLNNAFSANEQLEIKTTKVDNSAETTYDAEYLEFRGGNEYACNDTDDKIFALSYADLVNADYGFLEDSDRFIKASDFARATGVDVYGVGSSFNDDETFFGYSDCWTRSPATSGYQAGGSARVQDNYGQISSDTKVDYFEGVRLSLSINIA